MGRESHPELDKLKSPVVVAVVVVVLGEGEGVVTVVAVDVVAMVVVVVFRQTEGEQRAIRDWARDVQPPQLPRVHCSLSETL